MTITIELIRQKILDKAMRGELVEQDANEEPVEVLLKQIEQEKEKLIIEKKIKKQKPLPPIVEEEIPYEIPQNWKWVRLGDVSINRDSERIPLSLKERENQEKIYDYYGASGIIDKVSDYIFDKPLLLIGEDGANLLNRSTPIAFIAYGKYWVNNHAHVLDAPDLTILKFLMYFINSIDLKPYVTGTAQPKLNQTRLNNILVAVPPLQEQKRIVKKIESLFKLCDAWEKEVEKQQKYLSALSEKVLDDAMKGLLVEQDDNDEPAEVLVKKIEEEKQKLIEKKLIKKQKPLPPINKDEIPYNLPQGWKWERLGILIELISGRDLTKADYNDKGKGIPYIMGASNIQDGALKIERWTENPTVIGKKGDLLISVKGTIGKMAIQQIEEAHLSRQIMGIRIISEVEPLYIYAFLKTHISYLQSNAKSFIPGISRNDILMSKIPLAPIQEQKRIISKIERIIDYIKEFKSHMVLPD